LKLNKQLFFFIFVASILFISLASEAQTNFSPNKFTYLSTTNIPLPLPTIALFSTFTSTPTVDLEQTLDPEQTVDVVPSSTEVTETPVSTDEVLPEITSSFELTPTLDLSLPLPTTDPLDNLTITPTATFNIEQTIEVFPTEESSSTQLPEITLTSTDESVPGVTLEPDLTSTYVGEITPEMTASPEIFNDLVSPIDGEIISPNELILTWRLVENAEWYRIRISGIDTTTTFQRKFVDPLTICTSDICTITLTTTDISLQADQSYEWWVVYQLNGEKLRTSRDTFIVESTPQTPVLQPLFSYSFDDASYSTWMIGTLWDFDYGVNSAGIETRQSGQILPVLTENLSDTSLTISFQLLDSAINIRARESASGNYNFYLAASGLVELHKGTELLYTTTIAPIAPYYWHTLTFSVIQNRVIISVNNQTVVDLTDADSLPAGGISIITELYGIRGDPIVRLDELKVEISEFSFSEMEQKSESLENDAPRSDTQSLFTESNTRQVRRLNTLSNTSCNFTIPFQEFSNQVDVPLVDIVAYGTWQGGIKREQIRIKNTNVIADGTEDPSPGNVNQGIGLELIGNNDSEERHAAISPDGKRVAFSSNCSGTYQIYVLDLAKITATGYEQPVQMTLYGTNNLKPIWSPDSTRLAFVTTRDDVYSRIYMMDSYLDEQVEEAKPLVENSLGYQFDPTWSPDGRHIAFSASQPGLHNKIYQAKVYGSVNTPENLVTLVEGIVTVFDNVTTLVSVDQPSYSPDGRFIAFVSFGVIPTESVLNSYSDIYLQRIDQGVIQGIDQNDTKISLGLNLNLTSRSRNVYLGRYAYNELPSWSPDMKSIAFRSNVSEGGLVMKIHNLNFEINFVANRVSQVKFGNYGNWSSQPRVEHGYWIDSGGPSWSPYVACPSLDNNTFFSLLTVANLNLSQRYACYKEYWGLIFFGVYHETHDGSGLDLNELVSSGLLEQSEISYFFPIEINASHRYLYALAMVNSITFNANKNADPILYMGKNMECTARYLQCEDIDNNGQLDVWGNYPAWLGSGHDDTCTITYPSANQLPYCGERDFYNRTVKRFAFNDINSRWYKGYQNLMPYIFMAMHDEIYQETDILRDGIAARDANIGLETAGNFTTVVEPNETISQAYMRHLERNYYALTAENIIPAVFDDNYPPRVSSFAIPNYTVNTQTRFGLSGDSIHIIYLANKSENEKVWKTAVFLFEEIIPDGLRASTWPANSVCWLPNPNIEFELLVPRTYPQCN